MHTAWKDLVSGKFLVRITQMLSQVGAAGGGLQVDAIL